MKKNSQLTPFVAHGIKMMIETGVISNLIKRYGIIDGIHLLLYIYLCHKGPFTNYGREFSGFLNPPPPPM